MGIKHGHQIWTGMFSKARHVESSCNWFDRELQKSQSWLGDLTLV